MQAPQPSSREGKPVPPALDGFFSEGFALGNPSIEELAWALEAAFDYRGDVTLTLRDGERVCGYIFNRDARAAEPYLDLYPQNAAVKRRIHYRDISGIAFTGRDTASGKSWTTWLKKYQEKKAARARGEDVGKIGLEAEPLS